MYNVGVCYYDGRGVTRNISEAEKWLKKADEKGYAQAKPKMEELFGKEKEFYVYCYDHKTKKDKALVGATVVLVDKSGRFITRTGWTAKHAAVGAATSVSGKCNVRFRNYDRIKVSYVGYKDSYVTIGNDDYYRVMLKE